MQSNIGLNVKSNYHIDLIDSITSNIKQSGDFHNTPIHGFGSLLTGYKSSTSEVQYSSNTLQTSNIMNNLMVGSGTAQPSNTDKGLASPLWTVGADSVSREWIDKYTVRATGTYTFPATSSYVGTVTEVGLVNYGSSAYIPNEVCTHALLTDSEGQQISFNKTDLDILIINVTVELSLVSSDPTFKILPYSAVLQYASGLGTTRGDDWASVKFGYLNACRFDSDILNKIDGSVSLDTSISVNAAFYGKTNGPSDTYIRYSKSRLVATDITSETYYKYIAVPGIGYWDLTDPNVFPPYEIKNITIGTGDGSKTEFTNPLSYFKANTDKVYKNGVQLTRGVDYTISNVSNVGGLPEVTQDTFEVPIVSSGINRTLYNERTCAKPMLIPGVSTYFNVRNMPDNYAFAFNTDNPLYVEYPEPVTLNCMKSFGLSYAATNIENPQTLPTGTTFYIDYSTDGVNYTEVDSVTATGGGAFMLDFEEHTAKYWRIRTSFSGLNGAAVMTGSKVNGMQNQMLTLNRKIPNIVFTVAPSDGDLLTMDVTMDRAMKNDKFVIDVECKINFSY